MTHISELKIEKFRGLHDLVLQDLGRVNLLVGENNFGKTSVLEAIEIFCRPLDLEGWLTIASRREGRYSSFRAIETLRWLFPQIEEMPVGLYSGSISLFGKGDCPIIEVEAQYTEFFGLGGTDENETPFNADVEQNRKLGADLEVSTIFDRMQFPLFETEPLGRKGKHFELWQGERVSFYRKPEEPLFPVEMVAPFSHLVETIPVRYLSRTTLQGNAEDYERLVNLLRLIDKDIMGLDILAPSGVKPGLYIERKNAGFSPISTFGDGIRRVLALAPALSKATNGVLLIDEIETSIHTSALKAVFKWMVQACDLYDIQIFATTHSLEAIDALLSAADEEQSALNVYRLERTPERTTSVRFDKSELTILREHLGQEVR